MEARHRCTFRFPIPAVAVVALLLGVPFAAPTLSARQAVPASASAVSTPLTLEQQEAFLKRAKVIRARGAGKGVTGTLRATLSDGTITHDASIQTVDEAMREFRSNRGVELNFVDSWRYNVAAYRLDRLLELGMTPPSIERDYQGKTGAYTWWVDDFLMDEGARLKQKASAPDTEAWNRQMWHVRLFDQLIANVDRNLGNLLIDQRWTVWMIDHSRAFRLNDKVKTAANLTKCDRVVFERLKKLDEPTLRETMGHYLTRPEIRGMLARRNEIVALLEKAGPTALIDRAKK